MSTPQNSLIPHISTHFRLVNTGGYYYGDLTLGKIYKIEKWLEEDAILFKDDIGDPRNWTTHFPLEDASYERNLEKILE